MQKTNLFFVHLFASKDQKIEKKKKPKLKKKPSLNLRSLGLRRTTKRHRFVIAASTQCRRSRNARVAVLFVNISVVTKYCNSF